MTAPTTPPTSPERHGLTFWAAFATGAAITVYFGIGGALHDLPATAARLSLVKWIVATDVVHDLVVAPIACAVAWSTARWLPRTLRVPLQWACFASAVVIFVVQNALRGTGGFRHNPTIQPLDYATSTATVLGVVWLAAAVWAIVRAWRGIDPR